jgi:hypothetical protein
MEKSHKTDEYGCTQATPSAAIPPKLHTHLEYRSDDRPQLTAQQHSHATTVVVVVVVVVVAAAAVFLVVRSYFLLHHVCCC